MLAGPPVIQPLSASRKRELVLESMRHYLFIIHLLSAQRLILVQLAPGKAIYYQFATLLVAGKDTETLKDATPKVLYLLSGTR